MSTITTANPSVSISGKPQKQRPRGFFVVRLSNFVVLILSVILIVWISRDTFSEVNLLGSSGYMKFQLMVCFF